MYYIYIFLIPFSRFRLEFCQMSFIFAYEIILVGSQRNTRGEKGKWIAPSPRLCAVPLKMRSSARFSWQTNHLVKELTPTVAPHFTIPDRASHRSIRSDPSDPILRGI